MKHIYRLIGLLCVVLLASCSSMKSVGDGEYVLDRVEVSCDAPDFDASRLEQYVRQRTSPHWLPGVKRVIFDTLQAQRSCDDLKMAMQNEGYMQADVELMTLVKGKKLRARYILHPGEPYRVRCMTYDIRDLAIRQLLDSANAYGLYGDCAFSVSKLDEERKRLTRFLTENGYYRFHKDFIQYTADTTSRSRDIDITLTLMPYRANGNAPETAHPRYRINRIRYVSNDSGEIPLRMKVLRNNTMMEEGRYYSSADLQRTYNNFGRMGVVRFTNIRFSEPPDTAAAARPADGLLADGLLDCDIHVSTRQPNTLSFQPEGTNTAGDLGAAASLTYQNRNLFHGSELLSVEVRGAFEAITGLEGYENQDYQEYGFETRLQFPRFVAPFLMADFTRKSTATSELALNYSVQNRPEFHRRVFSVSWRYRWNDASRRHAYHLDPIDLNYVYMPWISHTFKEDYLDNQSNRNAILRYNYEDLFIMKTGFGFTYNNGATALKANVETAGNLLHALAGLARFKQNSQGQYTLFNIAYAQYAKFDIDYTHLLRFDADHSLALHAGFGIAYPYGNTTVLPFEKRYFSGGANSVRGWSVRELGPGKFRGTDGRIDFINQTGDMKLDMNAEYRARLFWKFQGATFVDAGNIWTLREYQEQPGGQFRLSEFYKQIAVSYGLGLRLNLDYFILRLDAGMKAVNPAYESSHEHYAILHPKFGRDFTLHFAVGLPF